MSDIIFDAALPSDSLLPSSSTFWEKQMELVLRNAAFKSRISNQSLTPQQILRNAFDPDACDADCLAYLALNLSIQLDDDLSLTQKRNLLKSAYTLHKQEGTVANIQNVVSALGYSGVAVYETAPAAYNTKPVPLTGAETQADQDWATFEIEINHDITQAVAVQIKNYLEELLPLRSKLKRIYKTLTVHDWDGKITFDGSHTFGSTQAITF